MIIEKFKQDFKKLLIFIYLGWWWASLSIPCFFTFSFKKNQQLLRSSIKPLYEIIQLKILVDNSTNVIEIFCLKKILWGVFNMVLVFFLFVENSAVPSLRRNFSNSLILSDLTRRLISYLITTMTLQISLIYALNI